MEELTKQIMGLQKTVTHLKTNLKFWISHEIKNVIRNNPNSSKTGEKRGGDENNDNTKKRNSHMGMQKSKQQKENDS
ncbi:Protein of unknown function [Gryllus bimaculatus]|nr:Protein of unknown function [Gryllus bimaculatus]